MSDEEKNLMYNQTLSMLLDLSNDELKKVRNVRCLTNGIIVGGFISYLAISLMNHSFDFNPGIIMTATGSFTGLICTIKEARIIRRAEKTAAKIVNDMEKSMNVVSDALSNSIFIMLGATGTVSGESFSPIMVHISNVPEDKDYVVYETLEDGLTLIDRVNLLREYILEVGYTGYEEDLDLLGVIEHNLNVDFSEQKYNDNYMDIKTMEKKVLTRACNHYGI